MDFLVIGNGSIWQFKIQKMLEELPDAAIEIVETYKAVSLAITKTIPDLVLTDEVLPEELSQVI